jgi:hypothetical protein
MVTGSAVAAAGIASDQAASAALRSAAAPHMQHSRSPEGAPPWKTP